MVRNVSDIIEEHLKRIIHQSRSGVIELKRSDLADLFQCVPSQINYVISTRFSFEQGYVVESKRGGGGYIRIRRVQLDEQQPVLGAVRSIGARMSQREAEGMIERLYREGHLSDREAALLRAAAHRDVLRLELPLRDEIRARLLSQMIVALFTVEDEEVDRRVQRRNHPNASNHQSIGKATASSAETTSAETREMSSEHQRDDDPASAKGSDLLGPGDD